MGRPNSAQNWEKSKLNHFSIFPPLKVFPALSAAVVVVVVAGFAALCRPLAGLLGVLQELVQAEGIFLLLPLKLNGAVATPAAVGAAEILVGDKPGRGRRREELQ